MTKHHRLDHNTPNMHNDVTTGKSGFAAKPSDVRVKEPDDHYPKLPETDYYHDQDSNRGPSPGPFHGDDLVSHGVNAPDVHTGGKNVDSYMYATEDHTEDSRELKHALDLENAVPVRVVDSVVKSVRITHQVFQPVLVAPGTMIRVFGKDPTRKSVFVQASGTGLIFVNPDVVVSGIVNANIGQFGFPVPSTGNIELDSEEEIWVYCGSDASAPGVYIQAIGQYLRATDTLEEYYNG
jgi:hypothetical protein